MKRSSRAAVRRLEAARFSPGCLSEALGRYEQFLRRPGRWLYVPLADCPCHDVLDARDQVQAMLCALPPSARRELNRIVSRLDAEFERRTLPDPYATRRLFGGWFDAPRWPWWHLRLTGP